MGNYFWRRAYNAYKYGLNKLSDLKYASQNITWKSTPNENKRPVENLLGDYLKRKVTYLLGAKDSNPCMRALDKSCIAELQGDSHLTRGETYTAYEKFLNNNKPVKDHSTYIIHGVAHDYKGIFQSKEGRKVIFNVKTKS